jgi:hypothetical protein
MRTIPPAIGVFTIKELIHRRLTRFVKHGYQTNPVRSLVEKHYMVVNGFIGGLAGFIIQVMIYPFDYFRIVISNEIKSHPNSGVIKYIKDAMLHRGIMGIFNGVTMNLLYITSARAVYFCFFDSFKNDMPNEYTKYLCSYLSLLCALVVNYPLDTIRKRVILAPEKYKSGRACTLHMYRHEPLSAFYSGWRVLPLQAVTFSTLMFIYDRMFT